MSIQRNLVACLLNVSEARRHTVIQEITKAALSINGGAKPIKCSVLNIFSDVDYNRSVITIVAPVKYIASSVKASCIRAYELIDLSTHSGGHPRLGSVDLVPFHPISENVTLEQCGNIAKELAKDLAESVPGSASFLFGFADQPKNRGLVKRRKEVKWYQGEHGFDYGQIKQDIGAQPSARYGLTGIGSIPYVMNCNVTIDTQDLAFGKQIAQIIRGSTTGGLPGVQSMAFQHEGAIEIACNVESIYSENEIDKTDLICSFGKYYHVAPATLATKISELASKGNITTQGAAIVGFTPEGAKRLAETALDANIEEYWKMQSKPMM